MNTNTHQKDTENLVVTSSRLIPGFFLFTVFIPISIILYLFCNLIMNFLYENNIEYLSNMIYTFFLFSIIIAIISEIIQPFSSMNNRQMVKKILRIIIKFVMIGYLLIIILGASLFFKDFNESIFYIEKTCIFEGIIF